MSLPPFKEKDLAGGLLLVALLLGAGIVAAAIGHDRVLLALVLAAEAAVGVLWWRGRKKSGTVRMLHGQEARHRALVSSANDAIVTFNTAGEITDWNGAAGKLYHYTEAEMLGQPITRLLPPAAHARFIADLRRIQAGGSPLILGQVVELPGLRKDGSVFPMELSMAEWEVDGQRFFTGTLRDITNRKAAGETLRLQSAALTAAANGIVITDREGTIVWANPAFSRLTGYPLAEAVGRNPRDLVKSGRQDPMVYEQMWKAILAGQTWTGVMVNRRKDGSFYPEGQTITPVADDRGEITHFIAFKQDLTEQKRTEAGLRLFRTLIDRSNDVIAVVDPATAHIIDANDCACRNLGYSRDELMALTVFDVVVGLDQAAFESVNTRLRASRHLTLEGEHRRKDGAIYPVESSLSLIVDDREYVVMIARGIAERKTADRQLREQNEILSRAHEGVMIVDLANHVSLWNHGAEAIFGWTAAEAIGRAPEELMGLEEPGSVSGLRAAVDRDGFWNGELRAQTRDGRKLIVEYRTTLVRDEAGRSRARLSFFADVTEKKTLEEKFLHAQRLESIGMLAAGIAHDLNNMLAPIVFAAPMLRESLSSPRDLNILKIVEQSAARGAGLVKQILGFVHGAAGELRPTQVKHLVRDVTNVIEQTFPKSIRLEHDIPSDLWIVQGNATQIHQVLLNLCVNARDAMPTGGTLKLTAGNRLLEAAEAATIPGARRGAWVVLEVTDTGTGMSPELLERIWQPFFTTKGPDKGTGLGLSTVRGIVASHHGFIDLQTEVGRGTTFRVFLPSVAVESPQPAGAPTTGIPEGQGELVLVVDDDEPIRKLVASILGKYGYRVVLCGDGVEAIAYFVSHPGEIAAVVTDVDMPRLGGVALSRALLQLQPGIRLLAMSGLSRSAVDGSDLAAVQKLAHVFLLKPFKTEDLLRAMHNLLHPPAKP